MVKNTRQRRWLLSATVVTSASGLLACGSDRTLGCMGFYAGSEADGGTGAEAGTEGGADIAAPLADAGIVLPREKIETVLATA